MLGRALGGTAHLGSSILASYLILFLANLQFFTLPSVRSIYLRWMKLGREITKCVLDGEVGFGFREIGRSYRRVSDGSIA